MILVRKATPDDIDWLVEQVREFAKMWGTKRPLFPADESFARTGLLGLVNTHLTLIAESEAGRLGFIAGFVVQHPFNPEIRLLSETFWWVAPEHRGTRAGLKLLDAFTAWGRENVDWITFGLEHASPVKDDCLLRRGYRHQERNFLLEA